MLISKSSQSTSRRISFSEALAMVRSTGSLEALPHEPLRLRSTSADTDAADEELPSAGDSLPAIAELERPARSGTLASQTSSRLAQSQQRRTASRAGTRSLPPPAAAADDDTAASHCNCRRCPPAGCYARALDGHYRQCFCVRCFTVRQMFQYHFISWRVLVQKYTLETYSISEHNAATTLQSFDLRRLLISLFIRVCILLLLFLSTQT